MITGIFGGSFNPIHNGHIQIALNLLEKQVVDKIIFVPCHISPHKIDYTYAGSKERIEMVKTAIEGLSGLYVSDYEINNAGISYSYNTLKFFSKTENNLKLIIGYDNLEKFSTWYKYKEILSISDLIVLKRTTENPVVPSSLSEFIKKILFFNNSLINISSTKIREKIRNGENTDPLLPKKVAEYINQYSLYL